MTLTKEEKDYLREYICSFRHGITPQFLENISIKTDEEIKTLIDEWKTQEITKINKKIAKLQIKLNDLS